ncbi:MAG: thymidine phosphorylase [Ruminococcus flavefaciens]|nr:thymidine phosphorylase [Ruminococcus flavefaciens]
MNTYDIIDKKKKGIELSREEIEDFINGYVQGEVADYCMSAWLMAVYYQGMTDQELLVLTDVMAKSGDQVDLSAIEGIKVDKHSTGGVGDKVTLAVAPIVAACGGKVAKMSGRGLGFTGGTIDKLEAIPGLSTTIPEEDFFKMVNQNGLAVMGQSAKIAPADKLIYALRDVTATVDSIPLIASSIMSKKLAAGSDKIVLDVTVGSGAFMKDLDEAILLAKKMIAIGEGAGRETVALLTNMDLPLGCAVGNSIELMEAVETLQGNGSEDFVEICRSIAAIMLELAGIGTREECIHKIDEVIGDGSALHKLAEMVSAQGGDAEYIYHPEKFQKAAVEKDLIAWEDGYVTQMDTEECGKAAVLLGAGREKKEDHIDMTAGIRFYQKTGAKVSKGEILATVYASEERRADLAIEKLKKCYQISDIEPQQPKAILGYVTKNGVVE